MTQTERLRKHLLEHKSINPLEAWVKLGIYRLSARINELRKEMPVYTDHSDLTNQFGEKCRVACYRLEIND